MGARRDLVLLRHFLKTALRDGGTNVQEHTSAETYSLKAFKAPQADIRKVCVPVRTCPLAHKSSKPTSPPLPQHDGHHLHGRWPSLILPTLAKLQLVWRRLCGVVLFLPSLVEHTLAAAYYPSIVFKSIRRRIFLETLPRRGRL